MGSALENYFRAANDPLICNPLLTAEIEVIVEQTFVKDTSRNDTFDVHSIYGIAQSVVDLSLRYRVHWYGFDSTSDTWETIESFDKDMTDTLCRFHYRVYNHCHYCITNNTATNVESIFFGKMMDGMEEESGSNVINLKIRHLAKNTSDVKTWTRYTVSMVHVQTQTQDTAALVDVETQTTTGALMMDVSVQTDPEKSISTRKKRKDVRSLDMNLACDQCMAKFTNNSHLTRHLKSVHAPSSRIPCRKCGKTFKNQRSLTSHQKLARCKGNKKKNVPKKKDRMKMEKTPNTKTKPAKPRMKK